ncbi:MAG: malto-oligosyltrehalose trehalohydrolase, partial [Thermomicrobiales bacterium]|nr:malto-oligosyltrehalose trehalohydrolase [Thermomicrobiales bacterium]
MTNHWPPSLGANITHRGVRFGVWAPEHDRCRVVISDDHGERTLEMTRPHDGVWSITDPLATAGSRYAFLPGDEPETPDVYSRFQPDGVHGRSEVIDPSTFVWTDQDWHGCRPEDAIVYELHVGTYTPEGTWDALIDQLPVIAEFGVTVLEIMPVAQCPGNRNWGYDGVDHFAPANSYGRPDDMRRFVDIAHRHGLAVILDVVYNHFGPEGNYTGRYSSYYLSATNRTDWGPALNWDGAHSHHVRQWAIDNVCYWITEFHIDGFRFDATQALLDSSSISILAELGQRACEVAGDKTLYLVAEDGRHDIARTRSVERGGDGMNAVWADDFHHEMRVHLTNDSEMWLQYAAGTISEIATTINGGFGPFTGGIGKSSGVDEDDPAYAFVHCLQNHDQVGNRPLGERLHHLINSDRYKVASALLLFDPETPLIFMGQEFAASTPFSFFTDMPEELGKMVTEGRRREFSGFAAFSDPATRDGIPDPQAESTFTRSKLRLEERDTHGGIYGLYRDLIQLRRSQPAMRSTDRRTCVATAMGAELIQVVRSANGQELVLLANFGPETSVPHDGDWSLLLSTDEVRYGGNGNPTEAGFVPARSALIMARS